MGKWFAGCWQSVAAIICLMSLAGCGGHKPPGQSVLPARITLSPAVSASVQLGSTFNFTASAANASGSAINPAFTFTSSDTNILNVAANGVACAGKWDATFTVCTPLNSGVVQVTAQALGASSSPTVVFVHPPVDHITVSEFVNTNPPPLAGPCFSQGQSITLQATAWSGGNDVTTAVGPFTWSAMSSNVVTLTPINTNVTLQQTNTTFSIAGNRATATANVPGLTQVFASASGVSSTPFQQVTPNGIAPWDFFETCPVQNITIALGPTGTFNGPTTFSVDKGVAEPATAIVTDVLGNNLTKVPLTWSASQPGAVSAQTSCTQETCSIGTPNQGSGTVTASCSPPTCNIGFPLRPAGLATLPDYIPVPVYATTAISGVVTGAPTTASILATSFDCGPSTLIDSTCGVSLYNISASKFVAGPPTAFPTSPNSILFDPQAGSNKAYEGSAFGAQTINLSNVGTSTNPFAALGTVTGKVLAVSRSGNVAIFSDVEHTPNQVYVVDTTISSAPAITALNISGATVAAFSPDGIKAFIAGVDSNGNPAIFIYSTLLALQEIPLPAQSNVNAIEFSPNGAFAYVVNSVASNASITAYNMCDNSVAATLGSLPVPSFVKLIPNVHLDSSSANTIPDGVHMIFLDASGFTVVTSTSSAPPIATFNTPSPLCPQTTSFVGTNRVNFGQGELDPVNFFVSPDGTQVYILASNLSFILNYSFNTGAVSGIALVNNATPLDGDMTIDGTQIYIAGSDGTMHVISTNVPADLQQIAFPSVLNSQNPFCVANPIENQPCKLDFVGVKP